MPGYNSRVLHSNVFASALATHPTRQVALDAVVDLLAVTHDPATVQAYERAMRRGEQFPPISVVRVPGRLLVADGHKRFAAYRRLGAEEIVVEVWPWRRWWLDQWHQARRHAANVRRATGAEPREARRLVIATTGHWRRVASSLVTRAWRRG